MEFQATPKLNEALAQAKLAFEPIIRDETAAFSTKNGGRIEFDYADLDDIIPAVTAALSANGLALTSQITPVDGRLYLISRLLHSSGEALASYYPLPIEPGSDPKSFGSSITFGRRYNTLCLLEINTVDDEASKKEKRTKAGMEIKKQFNSERAAPAKSTPQQISSGAQQSPSKGTNSIALYPRHIDIVRRTRELTGHTNVQVKDQILAMTENKCSSPDQLAPHKLEELLESLVVGCVLEDYPSLDNARAAYRGKVGTLKASGMPIEDAIASFLEPEPVLTN
jgi:hypothetical protein